jgi:hypothetical protein
LIDFLLALLRLRNFSLNPFRTCSFNFLFLSTGWSLGSNLFLLVVFLVYFLFYFFFDGTGDFLLQDNLGGGGQEKFLDFGVVAGEELA